MEQKSMDCSCICGDTCDNSDVPLVKHELGKKTVGHLQISFNLPIEGIRDLDFEDIESMKRKKQ